MLDRLLDGLEAQAVTLGDLPDDLVARYRAADGRALLEIVPAADLRDEVARARFVDAVQAVAPQVSGVPVTIVEAGRSEEHTSELQSLMRISYAVFCLTQKTTTVVNNTTNRRTYALNTS